MWNNYEFASFFSQLIPCTIPIRRVNRALNKKKEVPRKYFMVSNLFMLSISKKQKKEVLPKITQVLKINNVLVKRHLEELNH